MMGCDVPLIGDFHYNGHVLLEKHPEAAKILAKYRINPGNVGFGRKRDRQFATIVEQALKGVVRESLERVAENGLPGDHHFYISFLSGYPGVIMPDSLRARYPEEITIAELKAGSIFGEISLISKHPRNTSAIASSAQVVVMKITNEVIDKFHLAIQKKFQKQLDY